MTSLVSTALDGFITHPSNLFARRRLLLLLLGYGFMANSQPVSGADCIPPPAGLISWWRGEGNGNDTTAGNHASLLGGVAFAPGEVGQGFSFDGLDDRVIVPDSPSLNFGPGTPFSIEAWIQPLPAVTDFGVQTIVDKRSTPSFLSAVGYAFGLIDGKLFCQLADAPLTTLNFATYTAPDPDLRDGQFHLVAMAVDRTATNGGKLYVDGQVVLTFDPTVQPGDLSTTEPLRIGNHADPALNSHFKGRIDEVALYNRAVSAAELEAIYAAGSAGKCQPPLPPPPCTPAPAGLVSWWRAESNALDSADSNNGTLQNGAAIVAGKVGQAFSLDGVDDFVSVDDAPNLRFGPTSPMTVDMWVYRTSSKPVQHLIGKRAGCTGSSTEGTFQLFLDMNTGAGLGFGPPSGSCACSGQDLPLNTWTHLAGTFDATTLRLFINGQLVATTTGSLGPANTAPLKIGDSGSCGAFYGQAFGGLIDEFSLYNRALSTNEIQAIYNAGSAGKCAPSNPPPVIAPLITSQPTNLTVYVGSNATFRVTASGDAPLAYQWRLNDTNLDSKTASTLALTAVQFANAGPYSVVVSNAGGSVTSSPAMLTVNPLPPCVSVSDGLISWWRAEKDTTDSWNSNNGTTPFGLTVVGGKVGSAFGNPAISVPDSPSLRFSNSITVEAWVNPFSVSPTAPAPIVTKFEYDIRVPTPTNSSFYFGTTNGGRLFFVISTNGSPRTNVTVVASQPLSTNQWSHVAATYDGSTLRLYVNGQFIVDRGYSGGIFSGNASIGIGTLLFGGQIAQRFTGLIDEVSLYNRALASDEILAIYNADVVGKCLVPPSIVTQPQDQAIPLGEDVKFSVSVSGSRPLRYQWRFNGTNIASATNAALVLEKVQSNRMGNYSVFVSNAVGTAISASAALALLPAPTCTDTPAGLISWWPADGNLFDAMGTNNLAAIATGFVTGKVDRALVFNGDSSYANVSSSTSLNFSNDADFTLEAWIKASSLGGSTSSELIGKRLAVGITGVGYSLTVTQGRLAFWLGTATGNSKSLTNTSTFTSSSPDLRDDMFHHVAVTLNRTTTNGGKLYVDGQEVLAFDPTSRRASLINSSPLYLGLFFKGTIDEPAIYNRALTADEIRAIRQAGAAGKCKVKPSILVQPISQRVTVGSNVTFSAAAAGSPLIRYQWIFGKPISGATNSVYTITNIFARAHAGIYSVRVTNLFGSVLSSNAVLTVNNVPASSPQTVSLNEDTLTPITLMGTDPDNDPLSYLIVTPPAHGAVNGTGSNVTYLPNLNYNGSDNFVFKVNDGLVDSAPATVSLTVLPVNDAPVAKIVAAPLVEGAGITNLLVIASPCSNTVVVLDGSSSSDVEDDPLQYAWFLGASTNASATGVVAVVTLPLGTNAITLVVSDGAATTSASAVVEVITARQAIARLLLAPVHDARLPFFHELVLNVALLAAEVALHQGHHVVAIAWLELFQEEVRGLITPRNAALAEALRGRAGAIIDVIRDCITCELPRCKWSRLECQTDGKVRMRFSAPHGPVYVIEASTNLFHWEQIGVAREGGEGEFEFEDSHTARLPQRFYRIVAP